MAKRLCDVCVRPVNKSFLKRSHKVIVALTVQEIFEDHIAKKLAHGSLLQPEELRALSVRG
jgi:hypothetical protein